MRSHICAVRLGVSLVMLAVLAGLSGACLPTLEPGSSQSPLISSIEAEHMAVYPRGASEIKCSVSDTEGDEVEFMWSCTGGSLSGTGAVVTWQAPNSYGDYHIMVIVKDGKGGSAQYALTIAVISRPKDKSCCGR